VSKRGSTAIYIGGNRDSYHFRKSWLKVRKLRQEIVRRTY
jgi:hypothetical protein